MKDKRLMTTKFLFSIAIMLIDLTSGSSAFAEKVEVSGGGQCEGDITASDLNGDVGRSL